VSASYARNELDSGAAYSLAKAGYQQFWVLFKVSIRITTILNKYLQSLPESI
jgi:hypothetical protein